MSDMHPISILILLSLRYAHSLSSFRQNDVLKYDNSAKNNVTEVTEEWIEQPIDHFVARNKFWKMRYFQRLDLWKPNGPIYLYINGEWTASSRSIQSDRFLACQLARDTNGALFSTEHRYYGASIPVYPATVSWLKFLSAKQALADLAELIKYIKSADKFKLSKVVVVGGSYAGNLAAWMRVLYPDLVDAAVSSSGPVTAKKDFYEYLETVNDVYEKYGSLDCLNRIRRRFSHYSELMKSSSGIETLKREMNICDETDMHVAENQQLFFLENFSVFQGKAQYGTPEIIKKHCHELAENNWTHFKSDKNLNYKDDSYCNDYDFTGLIEGEKSDKKSAMFFWLYQSCTEFGYFQTTTSNKQPFGNGTPVDLYIKLCQGIYGEDFNDERVNDGVTESNVIYGGLTPNVTNVIFTHGDMDPWHRLGILTNLSETVIVRMTNGTSHCDILSASRREPRALTDDREYVKTLIKKWIT